jgi:hypothetical protein
MKSFLRGSLLYALLLSTAASADNSSLIGRVIDGDSLQPLADVMVIVTLGESQGQHVAVTDARGNYSFRRLPVGSHTLRFEKPLYKVSAREGLELRPNRIVRYDVRLFSTSLKECARDSDSPVEVGVNPPPADQDFIRRIAVARTPRGHHRPRCPEARGAIARTPSWMLARGPVPVPDGLPRLVYRAPSADRCSPDFGAR